MSFQKVWTCRPAIEIVDRDAQISESASTASHSPDRCTSAKGSRRRCRLFRTFLIRSTAPSTCLNCRRAALPAGATTVTCWAPEGPVSSCWEQGERPAIADDRPRAGGAKGSLGRSSRHGRRGAVRRGRRCRPRGNEGARRRPAERRAGPRPARRMDGWQPRRRPRPPAVPASPAHPGCRRAGPAGHSRGPRRFRCSSRRWSRWPASCGACRRRRR